MLHWEVSTWEKIKIHEIMRCSHGLRGSLFVCMCIYVNYISLSNTSLPFHSQVFWRSSLCLAAVHPHFLTFRSPSSNSSILVSLLSKLRPSSWPLCCCISQDAFVLIFVFLSSFSSTRHCRPSLLLAALFCYCKICKITFCCLFLFSFLAPAFLLHF